MKYITRDTLSASILARWNLQYMAHGSTMSTRIASTTKQLIEADRSGRLTADKAERIIGNTWWTTPICRACGLSQFCTIDDGAGELGICDRCAPTASTTAPA